MFKYYKFHVVQRIYEINVNRSIDNSSKIVREILPKKP